MDAVEYVKQRERMCDYYVNCGDCPAGNYEGCSSLNEIPNLVPIVEKWTKEHPAKTRQSELLKLFPNTKIDDAGILCMCPMNFNSETYKDENKCFCIDVRDDIHCDKCRRDFWLKEIG